MKDVFGKALYAYFKGDTKTPYSIRRDDGDFSEDLADDYFKPALAGKEKAVSKYIRGKILDVGCGAGRTLLYFQKKKFDMLGIDSSKFLVDVCKARGCNAKVMDVFNLKQTNAFDTVLLFGNGLGIGGDLPGVEKLLKKLFKVTKKSGHLLLTGIDVTKTKNKKHIAYHNKNLKDGKYIGEIKIRIEYKNLIGTYFNWIHVDVDTLKKLAKKTKWKLVEINMFKDGQYSAVLCRR